jgi:hypothetical protein
MARIILLAFVVLLATASVASARIRPMPGPTTYGFAHQIGPHGYS